MTSRPLGRALYPSAPRRRSPHNTPSASLDGRCGELSANLLRIIAGGGKEYELVHQIQKTLDAYQAIYDKQSSRYWIQVMRDAVLRQRWSQQLHDANKKDRDRWINDGTSELEHAKGQIIEASLRIVAFELVDQRTQVSVAENELYQAIRRFNEARRR